MNQKSNDDDVIQIEDPPARLLIFYSFYSWPSVLLSKRSLILIKRIDNQKIECTHLTMESFDSLAAVNPSRSNWRVRVKILRNYFSYNRSRTGDLWLILSDERWARVNAYVDRNCVYELEGFLREGDWKILEHFDVSIDDAPSMLIDHRYKITISRRTLVSDSHAISRNLFTSFVPFQIVLDGSIGTNYLIELKGKITSFGIIKNCASGQGDRSGEITNIETTSYENDCYIFVFYIEDIRGKEVRCLATANEALKVAHTIHNNYVEDDLCVLRWWKIHEIGPGSFGIRSETEVSQLLINPPGVWNPNITIM